MPQRTKLPWVWIVVGLGLLLGAGVGTLVFFMQHQPEQVQPPSPRPRVQPGGKAAQAPSSPIPSSQVRKLSEPVPAVQEPSATADSALAAPRDPAGKATDVPEAQAPGEGASAEGRVGMAAAVPAEAPAPGSDTDSGAGGSVEEPMLAPLAAGSNGAMASASPKRTPQRGKRVSSRTQSTLQKEWARTRNAYKALTRVHACENLEFLCSRYESLEVEVLDLGESEDPELLGKVKALYRDIQKRKNGS